MKLYHYRSMNTALKEISNGTFHYSDRAELNDPIEGHVNLYWQGDEPAWEGLFRNYICSLYYGIHFYLLAAKYEEIEKRAVLADIHCLDNMPFGNLLKEASNLFVTDSHIQKTINYLGTKKIPCSVKLLRLILRFVHEIAFSICMKSMKAHKIIPEDQEEYYIPVEEMLDKTLADNLAQINEIEGKIALEISAAFLEDMVESRFLAETWEDAKSMTQRQIWFKVRIDFPAIYMSQIQEIIYPKGYVVCFSANNNNSSMWGNYADNHKGVCLIYQTETIGESETISVKSQVSLGKDRVSFSFRKDAVRKVKYHDPLIQRNFFESLGGLTYPQITAWLVTETGKKSEYLEKYGKEEWRKKYWADFEEKYCLKLPAWEQEEEYRLCLVDFIHEHTPEERNIAYEPETLTGVIFGIKTSEYDKLQLIRTIKGTGRNLEDFEFYQAEYDEEEQRIKVRNKKLFLR